MSNDFIDKQLELLEKKIPELEKDFKEKSKRMIPGYQDPETKQYQLDMHPTTFKDESTGFESGTVIFYIGAENEGKAYLRDFLIEMSFETQDERDACGIVLYTISKQIVEVGSAACQLMYRGSETKKKALIALTNIVGINTNIIPPDIYMQSEEPDIEIDTNKMVKGESFALNGIEPIFPNVF